jgi:hypothetical protein
MKHPFSLEEYQKLAIEAIKYLVEAAGGEAETYFENKNWDDRRYYYGELTDHIRDTEYLLGEMKRMLERGLKEDPDGDNS